MFDILKSVASIAVKTVALPISVAADVVTFGGLANDKERPYTADALSSIGEDIEDISK